MGSGFSRSQYRYDPKTEVLSSIALPAELSNKALQILDSGSRGHLFLTANEQGEKVRHHGAYVVKLVSQ